MGITKIILRKGVAFSMIDAVAQKKDEESMG